jgi:HK97 family phage major capsid protein
MATLDKYQIAAVEGFAAAVAAGQLSEGDALTVADKSFGSSGAEAHAHLKALLLAGERRQAELHRIVPSGTADFGGGTNEDAAVIRDKAYIARTLDAGRGHDTYCHRPEVVKALDTETSTGGADWVPEGFSNDFVQRVAGELRVGGAVPTYPMTTKSLTIPASGAWGVTKLVGEATSITASVFDDGLSSNATSKITLEAQKLAVAVPASMEWEADAFPTALENMRKTLYMSLARGIEEAIISGDSTSGAGGIDSDVTDADSNIKAWYGLRYYALTNTTPIDLSAGLDGDKCLDMLAAMQEWGVNPDDLCWVAGTGVRTRLLGLKDSGGTPLVTTVEKYGPGATILTGECGKLWGSAVLTSPCLREDLGPTGVFAGAGYEPPSAGLGSLILFNRTAFALGSRQTINLELDRRPAAQASLLIASARMDFAWAFDGEPICVVGTGIPLTSS